MSDNLPTTGNLSFKVLDRIVFRFAHARCGVGPTWEYDDITDEYYLHLFVKQQPDLNWDNPEVRQAIWKTMRFWLDRGCDGFRVRLIRVRQGVKLTSS